MWSILEEEVADILKMNWIEISTSVWKFVFGLREWRAIDAAERQTRKPNFITSQFQRASFYNIVSSLSENLLKYASR